MFIPGEGIRKECGVCGAILRVTREACPVCLNRRIEVGNQYIYIRDEVPSDEYKIQYSLDVDGWGKKPAKETTED